MTELSNYVMKDGKTQHLRGDKEQYVCWYKCVCTWNQKVEEVHLPYAPVAGFVLGNMFPEPVWVSTVFWDVVSETFTLICDSLDEVSDD